MISVFLRIESQMLCQDWITFCNVRPSDIFNIVQECSGDHLQVEWHRMAIMLLLARFIVTNQLDPIELVDCSLPSDWSIVHQSSTHPPRSLFLDEQSLVDRRSEKLVLRIGQKSTRLSTAQVVVAVFWPPQPPMVPWCTSET